MLKYVNFVFGMCVLAHSYSQETQNSMENNEAFGASELPLLADAGNTSSHIHVHKDSNVTVSEAKLAEDESLYFVSALFQKYSNSANLSLDGFTRLLCSLGLIPTLTETTNEADDTSRKLDRRGWNCSDLTFDEVQAIFDNREDRLSEHTHEEESHHEHADSHHDHDHQPNRNVGGAKTSSAQDGHTHHHDDHADADNHAHDDHNHHDDHDHGDHDHDHGDHLHDDKNHHQDHGDGVTDSHGPSSGASPLIPPSQPLPLSKNDSSAGEGKSSQQQDVPVDKGLKLGKTTQQTSSPARSLDHHHIHPNHSKCSSPKDLLKYFHIPMDSVSARDFILMSPLLLFQVDAGGCKDYDNYHGHDHDHHDHAAEQSSFSHIPGKVWGFSIAAVMVISLAGLLGVAVIPIMQKVFYNHLLQFLVAVAVGALSGDALLHLLPHALAKNLFHDDSSHDHGLHDDSSDADHLEAVWKGLIALLCIFFFFLIERILTIVTEKKRRKKTMSRLKKKHCERLCDVEKTGGVGAKLSAHEQSDYMNCDQMVMVVHPNRALKAYADATHDVLLHQCDESLSQPEQVFDDQDDSHTTLGHSHAHGHGHGHGHNHCDTVPGSVAAVAWMVILGDGIHNFSDGLAIGAAFASSITGGISTSIAVMCHELPHEIGDFAVLLRAGMSIKQAIVYNCVSSILCFIGMLVGVAIGNIANASLWIFAGVGGMFLYISLVDMLPEMTAVDTKKGENQYLHLFLQVCGMMIGAGIMLLIAVYEHDLQQSLG